MVNCLRQITIFSIRNPPMNFHMHDSFHLPFTQSEPFYHLIRQPVPPERYDKMRTALLKVGLRESGLPASCDHIRCAGSGFIHVFNPEQRLVGQIGFVHKMHGLSTFCTNVIPKGVAHAAVVVVDAAGAAVVVSSCGFLPLRLRIVADTFVRGLARVVADTPGNACG